MGDVTPRRDAPRQTAEAVLARLGMSAETAVPALEALGVWEGGTPRPEARRIVEAVAAGPTPELALRAFVRLAERQPAEWAALPSGDQGLESLRAMAVVAGASEALGELMAAIPGAASILGGPIQPWSADEAFTGCLETLDGFADVPSGLAAFQRRGLLRIAARDLLGAADTPTAAAELADLAQGVLAAAFIHAAQTLPSSLGEQVGTAGVAVIAMGKLGGRELNYVSDVDVIFVHEGELASATRICERFLRVLGEVTPEGRAYEVDPNLRPEGRDGPLTRTIESYIAYYERWAKTWEFQALLKARPIAGDEALGLRFMEAVEPYVWPDRLDGARVADIQRLKGVVETSRDVVRKGERQVKLGPGGLRDIEFAVQLLQLVHGRHDTSLRSPNTLEALAALAGGGYIDEGDAALFDDAYQFLRTVEHRLQLSRLRRTHTIPSDDGARLQLARATGFRGLRDVSALEQLDRELARVRGYVRRIHEKLFYRPLLDRFAEVSGREQAMVSGVGQEAATERLEALGFQNPSGALAELAALASGVSRHARLFRALLPALLPTIADSPDPDGGLAAFRRLAEHLTDAPQFLQTLRDTPPVGDLLARVLGRSRLVGEWLERQPEVFKELIDEARLSAVIEPEAYRKQAEGLLRRGGDVAAAADAVRRMRRREMARTAIRDLGGRADVAEVGIELTGIAEACLEAAIRLSTPEGVRMAVIGMGKLGGRELGYASDLDVLLVFEPADGRTAALDASAQVLRLLGEITPEGQAFQVDPNLRPEGKDGPLARTLDSYRSYYERWGEPWEFQALTQARWVAGDPDLGQEFLSLVAPFVYPAVVPADRLQAVRRMKARVERERAGGRRATGPRPRALRAARPSSARNAAAGGTGVRLGDRVDFKLGPGGLTDIEWTVQLLQLEAGGRDESLRVTGTVAGLDRCQAAGLLGAQDAGWLREGARMLWQARNALYLAGFRDTGRLPPGLGDQERIARMLGYARGETGAFLEDLGRTMRRVRKVHERVFYDA